jgi:PAS domain S-box-containing protein
MRTQATRSSNRTAAPRPRVAGAATAPPAGQIPGMLWSCDASGRLAWLNAAAKECFIPAGGAGRGTLVSRWIDAIHPDDRARCETVFERARAGLHPFRVTCRRLDAAGSALWVQDEATPRLSSQGRLLGFTGVALDISDVKNAEEELRAANERLRRSNQDLDEVARAASHDLKEPLSIVSVYSELLKRRYGDRLDDEASRFVKLSLDAVQRMHGLLNDLVSFLQVARLAETPSQPVDGSTVLQSALFQLRPVIEREEASVTWDQLPVVMAQEGHLQQLLVSLIDNALKFRSESAPRVHIGCVTHEDEAEIQVSDNGIGIDARHIPQVFGVFRRLHGYQYPGTGIGLALCTKIVERYGGRIWVDSTPGQGSTFRFTLPLPRRANRGLPEPPDPARGKRLIVLGSGCGTDSPSPQSEASKSRDRSG